MSYKWIISGFSPKIIQSRWFRRIVEAIFLIWVIVIMAFYYSYYPYFAIPMIWVTDNALLIIGVLIMFLCLSFIFFQTCKFLWPSFLNKIISALSLKKIHQKEIKFSYLFFPLFFVFSSFLWIYLIFKRSGAYFVLENDLKSIVWVCVLIILAFSFGYRLLKLFKYQFSDWLERFVFSEALGFGALMMVMFFLGVAHLYYQSVAFGLLGLILIFTYREIIELFNFLRKEKMVWQISPFFTFKNFVTVAIFILGFVYLCGAFQQYPMGFDGLHTYVAFPKIFSEAHEIVNFPYWIGSGFPHNGEMLFTLGFLLQGFTTIPSLIVTFLFLIGFSIYLLGRNLYTSEVGQLAVLIFFMMPMTAYFIIYDNKIDFILVFYVVVALYLLLKYFSSHRFDHVILASIFMGLAAGVKYNFFYIFLPSFFAVVLLSKQIFFKEKMKVILVVSLMVILLFMPWAIKNIAYSGNPIEPIAGDYLSGKNVFIKNISESYTKVIDNDLNDAKLWFEDQDIKDWKYYATLPFRMTYNIKTTGESSYMNNIGPFFLIMFPIFIWILFFVKKEKELYIYIAAGFVFWFLTTHFLQWYAFPLFAIAAVILSVEFFGLKNKIMAFVLQTFVVIFFVLLVYKQLSYISSNQSFFETQEKASFDLISMSNWINDKVRDGIIWNVLFPAHYYINNSNERVIYDQGLFMFYFLADDKNDNQILNELHQLGVKYFLFKSSLTENNSFQLEGAYKYYVDSPYTGQAYINANMLFLKFKNKNLKKIANFGEFYLYELK